MRRWLSRPFLCKMGRHLFDPMERGWPVPNPTKTLDFHCGRCQKVIHTCHGLADQLTFLRGKGVADTYAGWNQP